MWRTCHWWKIICIVHANDVLIDTLARKYPFEMFFFVKGSCDLGMHVYFCSWLCTIHRIYLSDISMNVCQPVIIRWWTYVKSLKMLFLNLPFLCKLYAYHKLTSTKLITHVDGSMVIPTASLSFNPLQRLDYMPLPLRLYHYTVNTLLKEMLLRSSKWKFPVDRYLLLARAVLRFLS